MGLSRQEIGEIVEYLLVLVFAVLYRIRGGMFGLPSTTLARLAFSIPFGCYIAYILDDWYGLFAILTTWIGLVPAWGRFWAMKNLPNDMFLMMGRGAILSAPTALFLIYGYDDTLGWFYALYGAGIGVIYALSKLQRKYLGLYQKYTELAEYLTGAYLSLFFVVGY